MINLFSSLIKSGLQGIFGGVFGSLIYFGIKSILQCMPIIGGLAPLIACGSVVVLAFVGLRFFLSYFSFTSVLQYISFFSGTGIGSIVGWILWGYQRLCQ